MVTALEGKKESWPKQPSGIVGLSICPVSGLLPQDDNSCGPRFEYFIKGTEPKEKENLKQPVIVDTSNNRLAQPNQTENIATQEKLIVKDILGTLYCLDCSHEGETAQVIK
jgi:membrane carboxypeptidase/penicillin-binding protein